MKFHRNQLAVLLLALVLLSCKSESPIEGLWLVEKVQAGDMEMTPDAKWTRFNANQSYTSGNGWFQHDAGTWSLNENNQLSIETADGVKDPAGSFTVAIESNKMTWTRTEEGMEVTVNLIRINERPKAFGDKVIGAWDLITATRNGENILTEIDPEGTRLLYMGWDRRFRDHITGDNRKVGIYRPSAHGQTLEMVEYGSGNNITRWQTDISETSLKLTHKTDSTEEVREYVRVHELAN